MKIYTDGSCSNNGKPNARAGCGVYFGKDNPRNISKSVDTIQKEYGLSGINSNNRAELLAILIACDNAEPNDVIMTDSKYSINSLTVWIHKWKKNNFIGTNGKPVLNQDIIVLCHDKLTKKNLTLNYIQAHTGLLDPDSIGNSEADLLATSFESRF